MTFPVPQKWKNPLPFLRHVLRFGKHYLQRSFARNASIAPAAPALSIETTSVCNSRCVFCPNGAMERPRQKMGMDVLKKTVDESIRMGVSHYDFFVTIGDPLLDPLLLERARYVRSFAQIRDMGFSSTLQWLHLFDMDQFFACGFTWVHVSTTLSGPETYHEFFGVDKYDLMLNNLLALLRENNLRGKPMVIEIGIKPTPEPRRQIIDHPDFRLVQSLTDQDLAAMVMREDFFVCDWGGAVKLPEYLRPLPLWPREHRPCYRLFEGVQIFSNGKVGACACRDFEASSELILGSVQENTLTEMWNGEELARIRSNWQTGRRVPEICSNCRSYDPRVHPASKTK
jgi:radical SAM protein with 4Fe4S-binding SPASM domain